MKQRYTITAISENKPGVLYRIANLFLRRKINVESLTVSHIDEGKSRFTVLIDCSADLVEKIVKQLYRIVEITKVYENIEDDVIAREICLVKVSAKSLKSRREIEHLCYITGANIVNVSKDAIVVEKTGKEDEIDTLIELFRPIGIVEYVSSGRIAVKK